MLRRGITLANYPNFFDGTPRPAWAGPVLVSSVRFRQAGSLSDRRYAPVTANRLGRRPTLAEGIVLPVTTSGRVGNIAVQQRDLRYTVQDVGHLFALSSGGPEVDVQYVPQHASINRAALGSGLTQPNESLNWRQLECYAQYVAQRGFTPGAAFPVRNEEVLIEGFPGRKNRGGFRIYVNGTRLEFPRTSVYAPGGPRAQAPYFAVRWSVTPSYPPSASLAAPRGNDPILLSVVLSYARQATPVTWVEFCAIDFRNNPKYGREIGALMRPDRQRRLRINLKRSALRYGSAHPRRSSGA